MKNKLEIAALLLTVFAFGIGLGYGIPKKTKNKKDYPVEVTCEWIFSHNYHSCTMVGDSLKSDTLFKDGNKLKLKNITNIKYK